MRQFIISEEQLKQLLKHERELCYAHDSMFYCPSDDELEPTEDDLKEFTELEEYIKEHHDEILQDNAEGVRNVRIRRRYKTL